MAQSRRKFPLTIMLSVLVLLFVTLCSATDNSSSSKPRVNKVSLFAIFRPQAVLLFALIPKTSKTYKLKAKTEVEKENLEVTKQIAYINSPRLAI